MKSTGLQRDVNISKHLILLVILVTLVA